MPGARPRTRQAVLAATLDALATDGPGALRIEQVAARAGVNKSTIYRRWGDRTALVADALLAVSERDVPIPDTGTLQGDLRALARAVAAAVTSPTGRALVAGLAAADREDARALGRRFWEARGRANAVIVERACRRGDLPPGADPARLVELVAAPIWFRAFVTHRPLDGAFLDATADTAALALGARRSPPA